VRIPVTELDLVIPKVNRSRNTGAKIYERITALANGQTCTSADLLTNRSGGFIVLQIGLPNQPASCRQQGAAVTFAAGRNEQWPMLATMTLQHGVTVTLDNIGVQAPSTGGEEDGQLSGTGLPDRSAEPRDSS